MSIKMASTIILSSTIISSLQATKSNYFIGVELGQAKVNLSLPKASKIFEEETSKAIKFGVENYYQRISGKYFNSVNSDYNSFSLHYDRFLARGSIKPYVGATIGYTKHDLSQKYPSNWSTSGLIYGANVGFLIESSKNIFFELGYEYLLSQATGDICNDYSGVQKCTELNIDNITNIKFGIIYKF